MKQEIVLVDYTGERKHFEIDNFENVMVIQSHIVSGDEVATIIYKDFKTITFDSSDTRFENFDDGFYILKPDELTEFKKLRGPSYARERNYYKKRDKQ